MARVVGKEANMADVNSQSLLALSFHLFLLWRARGQEVTQGQHQHRLEYRVQQEEGERLAGVRVASSSVPV